MKKRCIICGKEIETEIRADTETFVVNLEPCVCSSCTMNLFDMYCDKEVQISNYKDGICTLLQSVVLDYPDNWNDEIEGFLIADIVRIMNEVGQSVTFDEAKLKLDNIKASIDKDPEKYQAMKKQLRSDKRDKAFVDIEPVKKELAVLQSEELTVTQDIRKKFRDIVAEVKESIRGQDKAVDSIGRVFFHNQQCLLYNSSGYLGPKVLKQNMLLVGPTGTGKTATITEYCRLLKLPYVIADMTAYTQAGYVGGQIEDIFLRLISAANGDLELAQRGIIILDEGDKNEAKDTHGDVDVGGKGVLDSLLKKVEGAEIDLGRGKIFNSTNTTFVAMGVYPRLYDIRKERVQGKKSIGFSANYEQITDYGEFVADDFVQHGFTQEYVGRFPIIVELKALSDEEYLDIFRNSKNSVYKQYKALFDFSYGIEFIVTPEGEKGIIENAKKYNIGARGLQRSVSNIVEDIEIRLMREDFSCKKIIVGKNCKVEIV